MKRKRTTLMAVIMTAIMMLATAIPAGATEVNKIDMKKELQLSSGVNSPTTNFTFNVQPSSDYTEGTEKMNPSEATNYDDYTVEAGPVDGLTGPTGIAASDASTGGGATSHLTIDKSKFTKPGIFRYKVNEIQGDDITGMVYDDTVYYVDLYIEYANNALQCSGAWAFKVTTDATSGTATASNKTELNFVNKLQTSDDGGNLHHVDVVKTVAGNQGDQTLEFEFTVTYTTDGQRELKYSKDYADSSHTWTNINSGGTIKLKHGESFRLAGLAESDTYTISEAHQGYTASAEIKIEDNTETVSIDQSEGTFSTGEQTMGTANVEITFTNTKTGIVPTGIFLNYKPFWIMGAVAVVLLIVFVGRRKNRYAEEL